MNKKGSDPFPFRDGTLSRKGSLPGREMVTIKRMGLDFNSLGFVNARDSVGDL